MKPKAIIFDLDNTLVNRKAAFSNYTEVFIERFIKYKDENHKREIKDFIRVSDRDGYRKRNDLFEEIFGNFEMRNSEITVESLLEHWFSEFFKFTTLMEGALAVLQELRSSNVKLGLITNGAVQIQNLKVDQVGIRDYFDSIIVSDEVKISKPDTRIFQLALQSLNAEPQESWYIGDHPINDVHGALSSGMNAVWMSGFMEWDNRLENPQYVIGHLNEIKRVIPSLLK